MKPLFDIDGDGIYEFIFNINGTSQEVLGYDGSSFVSKWTVNSEGTYVLIGAENMDNDPQLELVFLRHVIGATNYSPRIVIFDGLTGDIEYDTGGGINDHYNVAGFNWTSSMGSNINTGLNALADIDGDGRYELIYNKNGSINEVVGFDGNSYSINWSVSSLGTYVLIGCAEMDNDPQLELVFLEHIIGPLNYNPRFAIFDGIDGNIEYDSGGGGQDHYNIAGFNWTTTTGSNINTGFNALYDIDNDGLTELIYNVNGNTNEVLGFNGSSFVVSLSISSQNTFVLIGAENMDADPQRELIFLEHFVGNPNSNPKFIIFDGISGAIDYDTGTNPIHFNVAGFNWTSFTGSNINTGMKALFDIEGDGYYELAVNRNAADNILIGLGTVGLDENVPGSGQINAVVYPNPVKDIITIERSNVKDSDQLYIYDQRGRLIFENKIGNLNTMNISFLKPGIYYISINRMSYLKMVKI